MLKVESTNICSYKYSNNCINVTDVLNVFWKKKRKEKKKSLLNNQLRCPKHMKEILVCTEGIDNLSWLFHVEDRSVWLSPNG